MHGNGRFRNLIFGAISRAAMIALAIVFSLTLVLTQSAQAQTYRVIYSFTGGADGAWPYAGLTMGQTGALYGTAYGGGYFGYYCTPDGCGTVFKLSHSGSNWIFNSLYNFQGDPDGANPAARVIFGPNGSLYGTTFHGGGGVDCDTIFGTCGTVFSLIPPTETVIYAFGVSGYGGGSLPRSEVVFDQAGNIYGTAMDGYGADGYGTVYKLTPSANGWTESVIYNFQGRDGDLRGGLVFDSSGNLYGTTYVGGNPACTPPYDFGCGTIFQLMPSGSGWIKNVLYTFQGGNDGYNPWGGLIFDGSGNLYGTTSRGGAGGGGTVFMLTPSHGRWTFTTIYSFAGPDYGGPEASLLMDAAGNLYGTTVGDGAYQSGSVFKLTHGPGGWTYATLHDFTGGGDGGYPVGGVVFDADGNLYGTASGGGYQACDPPYNVGCGVVFEILGSPPASIKIDDISMFDSHTLEVDVTAQFSQDPASSKQITVNTNIEGVPLESILPLPPGDIGQQSKKLFIDLAANNVPLFADNQVFNVDATATEGQQQIGTDSKVGDIPLPVVHIHGILTDCFGDRIPHALFQYLNDFHTSYVEDDGSPDPFGTNNQLTKPYPTLVSFDYKSLKSPTTVIAANFASFINQLLASEGGGKKTYATKVNIVAHSLGGIISREAIANYGIDNAVNKLILVGSPSEGGTLAGPAYIDWNNFTYLFVVPLGLVLPEGHWLNVAACLVSGTEYTTSELLPTYDWWAPTLQLAEQGDLSIPSGAENPLLPRLNSAGLSSNVSYYAIVASGLTRTSTAFWGSDPLLWYLDLLFLDPPAPAFGPGDGIVPIRSQLAQDTGWRLGTGLGELNIFDDVRQLFHTDYFDSLRVQGDIETIIWPLNSPVTKGPRPRKGRPVGTRVRHQTEFPARIPSRMESPSTN